MTLAVKGLAVESGELDIGTGAEKCTLVATAQGLEIRKNGKVIFSTASTTEGAKTPVYLATFLDGKVMRVSGDLSPNKFASFYIYDDEETVEFVWNTNLRCFVSQVYQEIRFKYDVNTPTELNFINKQNGAKKRATLKLE